MKKDKRRDAPESFIAGSVGFVQKKSVPGTVFGMLCRFAVSFLGAAGVCMMFDNAFGFNDGAYDPAAVIFACLAFCAAWFVLCTAFYLNGVFFGVTSAAYAAAFLTAAGSFGWTESFVYAPLSLWNHILERLDSLGFSVLSGLRSYIPECDPATGQGAFYAKIGFYAFCGLVSFIFVSCLYNKVRAVPVIIMAGIVMTVTFTYNLLTDNFGFLLMVASGFGMLILLYYAAFTKDRTDNKKKEIKKPFKWQRRSFTQAAAPGLAAFTAAVMIFAAGAYPASRINTPATEMTVLNSFIDKARGIFMRYLIGDGGPGDAVEYDARKKSTEPIAREFSNKEMLTVTAGYPTGLYMRSWVSDYYAADKWTSLSETPVDVKITPEEITELFYLIVDVDANILTSSQAAETDCLERGFAKEFVTVRSSGLSGGTGVLASRFSSLYGLTDTKRTGKYEGDVGFLPGVGTAEISMKDAEYGTVAYSPIYKFIDQSQLDRDMRIYEIVLPYIEEYAGKRLNGSTAEDLDEWLAFAGAEINAEAERRGATVPEGCLINRLSGMKDADLAALLQKLDDVRKYEEYVYENCVATPFSDGGLLKNASAEAFGGIPTDNPSGVFECASKTARYLERTCSYSLAPQGYTDSGSYLAQFLTTAKNGYCVQYATAGALILRAGGIPTRYVDGYLASEFTQSGDRYKCTVRDSNAHAWVEAYIRGYGWMTFEMTEPMLDGMYRSPITSDPPDYQDTEQLPPDTSTHSRPVIDETNNEAVPVDSAETRAEMTETTGEPETLPGLSERSGKEIDGRKALLTAGIIILCLLAASLVIYVYLKKTSVKARRRLAMLKRAASGGSPDPEKDINEISDYLFYLFGLLDFTRGESELMTDFAKRTDEFTFRRKSFAAAAHALQKNSFGRCADANDCKDAAEYAIFLQKLTRIRLSPLKKFWYCKVLKTV